MSLFLLTMVICVSVLFTVTVTMSFIMPSTVLQKQTMRSFLQRLSRCRI